MRLVNLAATPVLLGIALAIPACEAPQATTTPARTDPGLSADDRATASYGVGWYLAQEVREGIEADGLNASFDLIVQGFADAIAGATPRFDEETMDEVLELVQAEMANRAAARLREEDPAFRALHDGNLERSAEAMAAFAEQEGVVILESGVQYVVLEAGDGPSAADARTIVFDFAARGLDREIGAADGVRRDLDDMLPGSVEVVSRMRVGDRWKVLIPPQLMYGPAGDPPFVGPNEAIAAEVTLKEVVR